MSIFFLLLLNYLPLQRSMDDSLDDGYQEDFESVAASEEKKKLPKLVSFADDEYIFYSFQPQ